MPGLVGRFQRDGRNRQDDLHGRIDGPDFGDRLGEVIVGLALVEVHKLIDGRVHEARDHARSDGEHRPVGASAPCLRQAQGEHEVIHVLDHLADLRQVALSISRDACTGGGDDRHFGPKRVDVVAVGGFPS
ncbi:hypothetical protein D9M70_612780 [compost metagenome]